MYYVKYCYFKRLETRFNKLTSWLVMLLGSRALHVFSCHLYKYIGALKIDNFLAITKIQEKQKLM